eukprot:CAMPEP_0179106810 /NCGR_PEP_ID=MMETSP0796-20121207/49683_1 /TAXON_ID=73915 /ORGANISM="Pyrodinium bahamense, Strain pbaha01" /LENGTH=38 /DNA_ID= /DNA_START= /DNA_END= /DNA_ORIENTATION=
MPSTPCVPDSMVVMASGPKKAASPASSILITVPALAGL